MCLLVCCFVQVPLLVALGVRCSAFCFAAIALNPRHFIRHSRTTPTPPPLFNSLLFYFPHLSSFSLSNNKRLSSFSSSSTSDLCCSLLLFLLGRHSFSQAWVSFSHGQPCCDDDCVVSLFSSLMICFYVHFCTFFCIFIYTFSSVPCCRPVQECECCPGEVCSIFNLFALFLG